MNTSPDMADRVETGMPAAPMIIPLGTRHDGQGSRFEGWKTVELPRYVFPSLSADGDEFPNVTWPACGRPETARACAELAESIRWRLPPAGSTILAFSSPGDGDGKTSLLLGLAPELAKRTAGNVLVVDASLRKPNLTTRLAFSSPLTHLGKAQICDTNLSGLKYLPAPVRGRWIESLRESWPLVLLDMPSLEHLGVAATMKHCDGVYLVVRLGYTVRRAVAEAASVVERSGGRLLGSVVME